MRFEEFNTPIDNKITEYQSYLIGSTYTPLEIKPSQFNMDLDLERYRELDEDNFVFNIESDIKPEIEDEIAKPVVNEPKKLYTHNDFINSVLTYKRPEPEPEPVTEPKNESLKPVTETINSVQGAHVDPTFKWERFKQRLSFNESEHNYRALNMKTNTNAQGKPIPGSGAWGRYQFIWYHSGNDIAKVTGITDPMKFLDNPAAQDKFFIWQFNNRLVPGAKRLRKEFPKVLSKWTDEQLIEMVHFQGEDGLRKRLKNGSLGQSSSINPSVLARLNKKVSDADLNKQGFLGNINKEHLALYHANKHLVKPRKN